MDNQETRCDKLFEIISHAFEETLSEVTGEPAMELVFDLDPKGDLSTAIIIGMSGKANGRIMISTLIGYAKKIASVMNMGNPLEYEDDLHIYVAEFANAFCQKVLPYINEEFGENSIYLSPPAVFSARELDVSTPHVSSMFAYYQSSYGKFIVDIGLSENTYDELQ